MTIQKLHDSLNKIDDQLAPYQTLSFISNITIFIGWVIIIGGALVTSVVYIFFIGNTINQFMNTQNTVAAIVLKTLGFALLLIPTTMLGLLVVAQGQMLQLMQDIRNDVDVTRQYIRHIGLHLARNIESTNEE